MLDLYFVHTSGTCRYYKRTTVSYQLTHKVSIRDCNTAMFDCFRWAFCNKTNHNVCSCWASCNKALWWSLIRTQENFKKLRLSLSFMRAIGHHKGIWVIRKVIANKSSIFSCWWFFFFYSYTWLWVIYFERWRLIKGQFWPDYLPSLIKL